ncbi:MAG TPA: class II aldolase/adducin family protein [Candidatus Baltobacteraceae bacterium]
MTDAHARADMVAYCRRLWDRRLVTGTSGNVSLRLSSGDLLVTPAGRCLGSVTDDELVIVDTQGTPRDPSARASSELPLHLAAYAARNDIACVVHTHPTFCVVWSKFGRVFDRDTVGARETLGPVAFVPYREPGTKDLAALCGSEFARGIDTVLMERHGLSAVGTSLERAFVLSDLAEEAARIAYFSRGDSRPGC